MLFTDRLQDGDFIAQLFFGMWLLPVGVENPDSLRGFDCGRRWR
jgi:hypothetical protein